MMIPVNITLQYVRDGVKESRRVQLTMETRIGDLINELIDELSLPREVEGERIHYHFIHQRQVLDHDSTLHEGSVQEGDILQLVVIDPDATVGKAMSGSVLSRLGGKASNESLPVNAALIAPSGERFDLLHTRALIGRADAKLGYPSEALDADLTTLDPGKTVSRPHALIVYSNDEFTVRDLYSQRGLVLNGKRVSPSKAEVLQNGDMLMLGDVLLQFKLEA
ncbi:MAG TPA: FHA domain-containing protein [Aggregatilineales bacterium]|nr:FHA domain-containing protein [Aggregatilineales bacterium]